MSEEKTEQKDCQHVVMRFADSLGGGVDTVWEHQKIIKDRGAVWIAKLGRSMAKAKIALLKAQIAKGVTTYLFLVQRDGKG